MGGKPPPLPSALGEGRAQPPWPPILGGVGEGVRHPKDHPKGALAAPPSLQAAASFHLLSSQHRLAKPCRISAIYTTPPSSCC